MSEITPSTGTAKPRGLWKVTLPRVPVSPTWKTGESRISAKAKQMLLLSRMLLGGEAWWLCHSVGVF